MYAETWRNEINVMPWHIGAAAEEDGLTKDCILVAVMSGNEMQTVSLHLAAKPEPPWGPAASEV